MVDFKVSVNVSEEGYEVIVEVKGKVSKATITYGMPAKMEIVGEGIDIADALEFLKEYSFFTEELAEAVSNLQSVLAKTTANMKQEYVIHAF